MRRQSVVDLDDESVAGNGACGGGDGSADGGGSGEATEDMPDWLLEAAEELKAV